MEFTSPRQLVLSAMGHTVAFGKGETHNLPPALHQLALEQGLEPAEPLAREAKPDDSARTEAIKEAMRAIAAGNKRGDFDAGGIPKAVAIKALAGAEPASNDERLALWGEVSRTNEG